MSLTYQPFGDTPSVNQLSQELRMNVPDGERVTSAVAGLALLASAAPVRSGPARALLLFGGLAFLYRAWSGRCPWYEKLGLDHRHDASGVPGNRGVKVEHSIQIHRSPKVLYDFWHDLVHLPKVMRHVESVERLSARRSAWKVKGPLGKTLSWDAEIINDAAGRLIAWQTLPGASVRNAGSVRFEETPGGGTLLKVSFEFDPPAGGVGAAVSAFLGRDPQRDLEEDLGEFKAFAERELEPFATQRA